MNRILSVEVSLIIGLFAIGLWANQWHVKTSGTSSGNGSDTNPWSLTTAFNHPSTVLAGDTIWLHGGTYQVTGGLTSQLTGTPTKPIIIRAIPGDRVTLDVGASNANRIFINGSYAWYWGFEVMSSALGRWTDSTGSGALVNRGLGIDIYQKGIKCINIILHDCAGGFGFWSGATESEIHGCLIYYNGWDAPDRGHTHAIYTQNQTGRKYLTDNIMFGQYSYGVHAYTEGGFIDSIAIDGNISFSSGGVSTISGWTTDILVGGAKVANNPIVQNNLTYFTISEAAGICINLGYGANVAYPVVKNNYCASGGTAIKLTSTTPNPEVTGNTFYGTVTGVSAATFPNNQFFTSTNKPNGVKAFVRPNKYEAGRANICIFDWDNVDNVKVDVSAVLNAGDQYEIRDAQNFYGNAVLNETFTGDSLTLPLNLTAVSSIIGTPATAFAHTPKEFNAFVLIKTGSSAVGSPVSRHQSNLLLKNIRISGGRLFIESDRNAVRAVEVISMSGKILDSRALDSRMSIPFNWPAGSYLIRLVSAHGDKVVKLVIDK